MGPIRPPSGLFVPPVVPSAFRAFPKEALTPPLSAPRQASVLQAPALAARPAALAAAPTAARLAALVARRLAASLPMVASLLTAGSRPTALLPVRGRWRRAVQG